MTELQITQLKKKHFLRSKNQSEKETIEDLDWERERKNKKKLCQKMNQIECRIYRMIMFHLKLTVLYQNFQTLTSFAVSFTRRANMPFIVVSRSFYFSFLSHFAFQWFWIFIRVEKGAFACQETSRHSGRICC